jgi:perosamine synthetase
MNKFIPVNTPKLDGNEKKYLLECIDSGWISSEGPFVERFEQDFAKFIGRKHGIAVTNGTAAIDAAIACLEIGPGDEVIVPTFTIISCVLQIIRCGATPVFVDCDQEDFNAIVTDIEALITVKTKAIMMVHIYGLPTDVDPILQLAEEYNLFVIEDAAEMHGQTYKGAKCGQFGDLSIFSFYPNKHITTGEGGMVLTDNDEFAERLRQLRNLCFIPSDRFVHESMGWNLRMTNMQAAIGVAQLEKIDQVINRKREIGRLYNDYFKDLPYVQLPVMNQPYSDNIYWVYSLVSKTLNRDAKFYMKKLTEKKIGTRPFFFPMHRQPIFQEYNFFNSKLFPNADYISKYGFYLPSGLGLSNDDIACVADAVIEVVKS